MHRAEPGLTAFIFPLNEAALFGNFVKSKKIRKFARLKPRG